MREIKFRAWHMARKILRFIVGVAISPAVCMLLIIDWLCGSDTVLAFTGSSLRFRGK